MYSAGQMDQQTNQQMDGRINNIIFNLYINISYIFEFNNIILSWQKTVCDQWLTLIYYEKGSSCSLISLHSGILKIPKAKKISQKLLSAYYKLDICQLLQLCDGTGLNWNILIYRPIETSAPYLFNSTEIQSLINMSHSQMLGKFEYGLPAKFWPL